jgi:exodeoxyribonuclease VII large subunit
MEGQGELDFLPQRRLWTVSGLLAQLKQGLEREFFDVWIEGEISNFHQAASRHCYFTLKDGQGQIRAALFASQARLLRVKLRDGLQVRVRGRVSVYEARGELQCYVAHVEPIGRGDLQAAFEALKEKLAREGLFDAGRKRPLPALPRRIGLITSPRGAAIADMVRVLHRRFPNLDLLLYPVAVQGAAAAGEIAAALDYFAAPGAPEVDLLIVGRGGGSLEDLWPFNDERVARALARTPVPVISAVGHETDFTIADFVADVRAPTPSAAAELAVRPKPEFVREQAALRRHLEQAMRYRLLRRRHQLDDLARHRAFYALQQRMTQRGQRLDELTHRLEGAMRRQLARSERRLTAAAAHARRQDPRLRLAAARRRLERGAERLGALWRERSAARRHRLAGVAALLEERNPLRLLQRGYALVFDAHGGLATAPEAFRDGDRMRIRFAAGWLDAEARKGKPPC